MMRLANLDDLPALAWLGRLMHGTSTYASMDYDEALVRNKLAELIDKKQFVVVAEGTNGELLGCMAGQVAPSWFGRDDVATDLALFIHPDHRGGMTAVRLVKAFVQWAQLAGAKQIRPGVTTGDERAAQLYERMGFTRVGACFVMQGV